MLLLYCRHSCVMWTGRFMLHSMNYQTNSTDGIGNWWQMKMITFVQYLPVLSALFLDSKSLPIYFSFAIAMCCKLQRNVMRHSGSRLRNELHTVLSLFFSFSSVLLRWSSMQLILSLDWPLQDYHRD